MTTFDFDIWFQGAPALSIGGDYDFGLWFQGVPVVDVGSVLGGLVPSIRRRAALMF